MPIDENGIITSQKKNSEDDESVKKIDWDKKRLVIEIIVNIVIAIIGYAAGRESAYFVHDGNVITYNIYTDTINSIDELNDVSSKKVTGEEVALYAMQFVGNPYVYGGESLTNGADSPGFVSAVYNHFGFVLPHSTGAIRNIGVEIRVEEVLPGDVICYSGHVGIYVGDGKIIHASTAATGIKLSDMHYRDILCIRRIISNY